MIIKNYLTILSKLQDGTIEIKFQDGTTQAFGSGSETVQLVIHNNKAISSIIHEGDIGFGRGYIEGWWSCNDILLFLKILTRNIALINKILYGNKLYNVVYRIFYYFNRNTVRHSKKNIEYHYDLGNEFYFKWLDVTKTYSSGLFRGNETLVDAQRNKYENIIKYLPNDAKNILEVGCGWGGFIQVAISQNENLKIKGLTLSNEQFSYVEEKFASNSNIDTKIQDYRNEFGKYDAVVSIEMFEAVGMEYWHVYFQKIHECLNDSGIAVIQTITIAEDIFEKYIKTSDFIRHFIFPGGMLPTRTIFEGIAKRYGFEVITSENFGLSYYKTLLEWLKNFDGMQSEIIKLGFNTEFIRKWRFYLAYCAAGFESGRTDVYQFVLRKN